jgi:FkbM family methyltransferase
MSNPSAFLLGKTPPALIRSAPDNGLMRFGLTILINRMCRKFGTRVAFLPGAFQISKGADALRVKPINWIYGPTISRDFESFFGSVESKREGDLNVVDYSKGGLQKFRLSGLEFEVSGFPEDERMIVDYFRWHRPQLGETVFDLGANCGLSVFYLSQCVGPTGKVCAFEPDPINFAVLLRNIERHKMTNVIPLQKAISGASGKMEFHSEGTIGSSLASQSSHPSIGTVEVVEVQSLTDACAQYGIPSFIKMDIEGAEIESITASKDFLRAHAIQFAIDTCHVVNGALTAGPVEALFKECGYEVISSDESGAMTTWARKLLPVAAN